MSETSGVPSVDGPAGKVITPRTKAWKRFVVDSLAMQEDNHVDFVRWSAPGERPL